MNYLKKKIINSILVICVVVLILVLFSCQPITTTNKGHDCSSLQKDSIFITGEHIHLLPEKLCSYAEDEWYVFENDIDTNYLNID